MPILRKGKRWILWRCMFMTFYSLQMHNFFPSFFFIANSKSVPHLLTQCITVTLMKDLPEQPRPFFETTHYQNNILSCSPSREFSSYSLYSIKVDPFSMSPVLLDGFYWIMVVPVKCHTFVVKRSTVPSLTS